MDVSDACACMKMPSLVRVVLAAAGIAGTAASSWFVSPSAPCIGHANYTSVDISVLPWPFTFSDPRGYGYTLSSPCNPNLACPGFEGQPVILCQEDAHTAGGYANCGMATPAIWSTTWGAPYCPSFQLFNFTITFGNGSDWRMTSVFFLQDSKVTTPTAQFVSEEPYENYNVVVTASCFGAGSPGC